MPEKVLFKRDQTLEQVAGHLVGMFYPELVDELDLVVVLRSENFPARPRRLAQIERITGLKAWLYRSRDYDQGEGDDFREPTPVFIIQIVESKFDRLPAEQKIAILDHELAHIVVNELDGGLAIDDEHDIEEFSNIVRRHGLYTDSLAIFAEAIDEGVENFSTRDEIKKQILEGVDFEL